jgi:leucyl/phenylalanyl-tRNA--protein transferase
MPEDDVSEDARVIPWLGAGDPFPPLEQALAEPNGLLAAGADLSPERLVEAYAGGVFPWFDEGEPILWWSPDPRMVLFVEELHVSRRLARVLRSGRFRVTLDTAFTDVMAGCAAPREGQDGTWIGPAMRRAYAALARRGIAHSAEAWAGDELVGGLYGVALGRMFFGESMFARRPDASKVAFVQLVRQLARWGFTLVDCQTSTRHLASLGAREIPRRAFAVEVARLIRQPPIPAPWRVDADLYNGSRG